MKLERIVSAIIVLAVLFPMTACAMNWCPPLMISAPGQGDGLSREECCRYFIILCCLMGGTYGDRLDWGDVPAVHR